MNHAGQGASSLGRPATAGLLRITPEQVFQQSQAVGIGLFDNIAAGQLSA